jgi:hypothetical protein
MTDFSTQQVKMFNKLFAHPPVGTGFGVPEKFLLQFVLFEALVRLVGHYYRERTTTQKKKSNAHTPLDISVVKRSFLHFHILVSEERLDLLLNSSLTIRNAKSARNLRNGLAHQWKAEDVKEVNGRYKTLNGALTEVIDVIKERVDSAKK